MKTRNQAFYIGYHHLTYACFLFILLQIIFLVCIQAISQQSIAEKFKKEKPYVLYTIKSNLETLDYDISDKAVISQLKETVFPRVKSITNSLNVIPIWQIKYLDHPIPSHLNSSPFYLTNYISNPFLMKIDLPGQNIAINIQFKVIPDVFWNSFIVSIIFMLAFIIAWAIFIYGFNFSFKARILKGFLTKRDDNNIDAKPKDLTGELISEVQTLMDQKSLMLSALSHDLKTPLTELELKLYLLEDQSFSKDLLRLTSDINKIVNTSLQYAKGFDHVKKDNINLNNLLSDISKEASSSNHQITFTSSKANIFYEVEPVLFKRMMLNLISNAKSYGKVCSINLDVNIDNKIQITVEDNGPGVPEKQLRLLGKPFFRADTSRSRKTGGTGLGLAIVKQIAQVHSLIVEFKNKPSGGLMVILVEI
ncbi:HAMP domain-containing histidine kinase [Francisellaceae bacterium]|nr:HAMP domain-containing histidine kinase [Francisellaceae bacterium]